MSSGSVQDIPPFLLPSPLQLLYYILIIRKAFFKNGFRRFLKEAINIRMIQDQDTGAGKTDAAPATTF